ncbi:MAG: triose-phosphate isomerase [Gemmatimonadetes bacterium]|nr:triose-phosphate isomerase [Gemmatimonadota bacterium]
MSRRLLIAGNWKMNLDSRGATALARAVKHEIVQRKLDRDVMLAPPYPYLDTVARALEGTPILLAGQDLSRHESGAFTGEVSAGMLIDLGCHGTLVGHSERREHGGDTDDTVRAKLERAIRSGLSAVLCVGESESVRETGAAASMAFVEGQLAAALAGLTEEECAKALTIAYEPVWAIGTGKTASTSDAAAMHAHLRASVANLYSEALASRLRILYGGSVNAANAADILGASEIDGVLVGGASLKIESFGTIYRAGAA